MARSPVVAEDLERIAAAPLPWEELAGRTVVITGANGFLPAYMVETLLFLNETKRLDVRIVGVVRDREKAQTRFEGRLGDALSLLVQDASSPLKLDGPADFIVHAASQASPKFYGKDPAGTILPNVVGTYNLLELARTRKSKAFLFFSSGEVYGTLRPEQIPIKEAECGHVDPMNVRSCYAEGKRAGETLCVSWAHQHGIPAKIVRPFHTYGPGMSLDDGRVYSDFVADVVAGRDIVMKSDGAAIRPYCYLADATIAFFMVLLKGETCQAYNVGNPKAEVSVLELAELLAHMFPEKRLRVVKHIGPRPPGYLQSPIPRNCPDIAKIQTLGWAPMLGLESGFRRTVQFYEGR